MITLFHAYVTQFVFTVDKKNIAKVTEIVNILQTKEQDKFSIGINDSDHYSFYFVRDKQVDFLLKTAIIVMHNRNTLIYNNNKCETDK